MGRRPQIPVWDFTDRVLGAFNDKDGRDSVRLLFRLDAPRASTSGLDGASFEVLVVDEDSKINVNQGRRARASRRHRLVAQLVGDDAEPAVRRALFRAGRRRATSRIARRSAPRSSTGRTQIRRSRALRSGSTTAQQAAPEDSFYERLDQPVHPQERPLRQLARDLPGARRGRRLLRQLRRCRSGRPEEALHDDLGRDKINVNGCSARGSFWRWICSQAAEPLHQGVRPGEGSVNSLTMMRLLPMLSDGRSGVLFGRMTSFRRSRARA